MKAIIIENEWEVDITIQAFLKDNLGLFESVQEELHCLMRGEEELLPKILQNDAIIVASTWMYKDQLQDFLDGFLNPKFPKTLTIFVHHITDRLNEWKHSYGDEQELFEKVKKLIKKGFIIYDFREDSDKGEVTDKLTLFNQGMFGDDKERTRHLYTYYRLKYSEKYDLFYFSHKYYNLKEVRKSEEELLKRKNK